MAISPLRNARDYNQALPGPIRWLHVAFASVAPAIDLISAPGRAWWARPALAGLVATLVLFPFDGRIMELARQVHLGGDIRQELAAWQQFGALGSIVVVALLIRLLDPARTRRVLDLAVAAVLAFVLCQALKMAIGRPRPGFDDPAILLGPFGAYPLGAEVGIRHAWEFWAGISSRLWSMPSSHTAAAAALAVFLIALYPRIRPLVILLVTIVGVSRVLFEVHWPSDVAAGAAVGIIAGRGALRLNLSGRLRPTTNPAPIDPLHSAP